MLEAQFEAYRCAVHQACSAPLPQVTQWCGLVVRAPRRHSGGLGSILKKGLSPHITYILLHAYRYQSLLGSSSPFLTLSHCCVCAHVPKERGTQSNVYTCRKSQLLSGIFTCIWLRTLGTFLPFHAMSETFKNFPISMPCRRLSKTSPSPCHVGDFQKLPHLHAMSETFKNFPISMQCRRLSKTSPSPCHVGDFQKRTSPSGNQTHDTLFCRQVFYQLSCDWGVGRFTLRCTCSRIHSYERVQQIFMTE